MSDKLKTRDEILEGLVIKVVAAQLSNDPNKRIDTAKAEAKQQLLDLILSTKLGKHHVGYDGSELPNIGEWDSGFNEALDQWEQNIKSLFGEE